MSINPSETNFDEVTIAYDENRPVVYVEHDEELALSPDAARNLAARWEQAAEGDNTGVSKTAGVTKAIQTIRNYADKVEGQ